MSTAYLRDLLERVGWTLLEALVALLAVEATRLPDEWLVPIAAVLAALKGIIARQVGDRESAAMLPAGGGR